jgi:hypothetical protein
VRLQPIGSAPHLNQRVFKLSTNQRFETIVKFLRKRLGVKEHESVFCYVGSVFSPALDEGVGNLWAVGGLVCAWLVSGLTVRSALNRMRSWLWGMPCRQRLVEERAWVVRLGVVCWWVMLNVNVSLRHVLLVGSVFNVQTSCYLVLQLMSPTIYIMRVVLTRRGYEKMQKKRYQR